MRVWVLQRAAPIGNTLYETINLSAHFTLAGAQRAAEKHWKAPIEWRSFTREDKIERWMSEDLDTEQDDSCYYKIEPFVIIVG